MWRRWCIIIKKAVSSGVAQVAQKYNIKKMISSGVAPVAYNDEEGGVFWEIWRR